jgi:hypothetical protein
MKKIILILGLLLAANSIYGQDIFKKYGLKEPLTLSKGRYVETFPNKEIVQIGTVMLNTRTNKIVEFLDEDTTAYAYKAEFSSRWLSPDPLAEKYPELSPYVYCINNPIRLVDPDGRIVKIANNTTGALANLAKVVATSFGQNVMNRLISSSQTYTANSVFWSGSSEYNDKTNNVYYVGDPWVSDFDGGSASSQLAMSHEFFHAYQDETNRIRYYNGEIANLPHMESEAVSFENYMRQSYGDSKYREKYGNFKTGDFHQFSATEKITNFSNIENNESKTSFGFSYTKTTKTAESYIGNTNIPNKTKTTSVTNYMVVSIDKDKKFSYKIYTSEEEYKKAIANW